MSLTRIDSVADDDGDQIVIEVDDAGRVWLTAQADGCTECGNGDTVAVCLGGDLLARFGEAWATARKIAEGSGE